jgi:Helix-turn-helix domain
MNERDAEGAIFAASFQLLYTADEAAVVLRVKPRWLKRQAAARKVPFTMLAGSYRFSARHLEEIMRIHEKAPESEVPSEVPGSVPGGIVQSALPTPAILRCGPGRLRGGWREVGKS